MRSSLPGRLVKPLGRFVLQHWVRHEELVRVRQQIRYLALAELLSRHKEELPDLTLYELSVFSQNGEDGVLQEILRRLGIHRGSFVEIGASSNEANCLVLADVFGWRGVVLEADEEEYAKLARKYVHVPSVRVVRMLVNRDNLTPDFFHSLGIPPEIDVLSIDIDGNDYWVWSGQTYLKPAVVVIEFNSELDPGQEVVQPYAPDRPWTGGAFFGASLGAMRKLARERGYRLVHVDLTGTNAFFVRSELVATRFPPEDEIVVRAANYFLYGFRHGEPRPDDPYVNLRDGSP